MTDNRVTRTSTIAASAVASGKYNFRTNDGEWEESDNLLPTEGLNHLLSVALNQGAAQPTWYIALFTNNYVPTAGITAATFQTTAGELVSSTEGYTQPNRVEWVEAAPVNGSIANSASPAQFTFATASTVTVYGAALLSASTKGATTGKLMSITRFAQPRVFYNGDTFDVTYAVNLASQ